MSHEIRSCLAGHSLMQGLTEDELDLVASRGRLLHTPTGHYVHRSGDSVESVFLVVSGRLNVTMVLPSGKEEQLISIGRGGQFGVLSIVLGEVSPVNAVAAEPTILIGIAEKDIEYLAQELPMLRRNFFRGFGKALSDHFVSPKSRLQVKVIACIPFGEAARDLVRSLASRLIELGEKIGVISDQPRGFDERANVHPLWNERSEHLSEAEIRSVLAEWHDAAHVFIEAGGEPSEDDLRKLVGEVSQVWWVCSSASCDLAIERLESIVRQETAWTEKSLFVWSLEPDEWVPPFRPQLADLVRRDFKVWLDEQPDASFSRRHSLDKLVHFMRGIQIGLALGGGAARGMAHLGVLQALEDRGIVVDMIAGTSAGALTGLPYCAGYSPEYEIESFSRDLKPEWIYSKLPKGSTWYVLAKYRTKSWDQMLRKHVFDWRLEQCAIPVFSVATDLVQSKQVIRESGDIVDAILESINLPVLSPPICREGKALLDGGILNTLPADVLVNHGCNFVIGVNVSSQINYEFAGNTPQTPTEQMTTPGVMTTLLRTLSVLERNMSAVGANAADFTIEPDVSDVDAAAFEETRRIAGIGRQATEQVLSRLTEMLHRLDSDLFP